MSNKEISALYRSHNISKIKFITDIKQLLFNKKYGNNHFIIGNFIGDLLNINNIRQEFLNSFLNN